MATMNRSDFCDRLEQAREAISANGGGLQKFQDIPPTHDFPPGVYLWPLLQLVEELVRQVNALKARGASDAWR